MGKGGGEREGEREKKRCHVELSIRQMESWDMLGYTELQEVAPNQTIVGV